MQLSFKLHFVYTHWKFENVRFIKISTATISTLKLVCSFYLCIWKRITNYFQTVAFLPIVFCLYPLTIWKCTLYQNKYSNNIYDKISLQLLVMHMKNNNKLFSNVGTFLPIVCCLYPLTIWKCTTKINWPKQDFNLPPPVQV